MNFLDAVWTYGFSRFSSSFLPVKFQVFGFIHHAAGLNIFYLMDFFLGIHHIPWGENDHWGEKMFTKITPQTPSQTAGLTEPANKKTPLFTGPQQAIKSKGTSRARFFCKSKCQGRIATNTQTGFENFKKKLENQSGKQPGHNHDHGSPKKTPLQPKQRRETGRRVTQPMQPEK